MAFAKIRTSTGLPKIKSYGWGDALSGAVGGASAGASFGPWGAAGGAAVGLVSGIIQGDAREEAERKAQAQQQLQRLQMDRQLKENYSSAVLSTYPTLGVEGRSYYSKGGRLAIPTASDIAADGYARLMYSIAGNPNFRKPKHTMVRAMGGAISDKAEGGDLVPLANDTYLVKGDTHNQDTNGDGKTGVTLSTPQGKNVAEVEDDEVLVGDKVYSKRLGFAPIAEKLGVTLGKNEEKANSGDSYSAGTGKRMAEITKGKLARLYASQEEFKVAHGIGDFKKANGSQLSKYGYGDPIDYSKFANDYMSGNAYPAQKDYLKVGTGETTNNGVAQSSNWSWSMGDTPTYPGSTPAPITMDQTARRPISTPVASPSASTGLAKPTDWNGISNTAVNIAGKLVPFIDNVANADLTNKTPMIPKPILENPVSMKTDINISPQLQAIRESRSAYAKDINDNTSNSATGNANKAAYYAKTLGDANSLYGYKENTETQLKNADMAQKYGAYNRNLAKVNDYNTEVMNREGVVQGRQSANVQNFVGDLQQGIIDDRNKALDDKKIQLQTKTNSMNNDAAINESWDEHAKYANSDPKYKAWLKERVQTLGSSTTKAKWNSQFPKEQIS